VFPRSSGTLPLLPFIALRDSTSGFLATLRVCLGRSSLQRFGSARLPWVSSSFPPGLPQLYGSLAVPPRGGSFREVRARFRFVAVAFGAPFASSSSGHLLVSRLRLVASRLCLPWVSPREKMPDPGFSLFVPSHFSASVRHSL
jgi:hypothetical protein